MSSSTLRARRPRSGKAAKQTGSAMRKTKQLGAAAASAASAAASLAAFATMPEDASAELCEAVRCCCMIESDTEFGCGVLVQSSAAPWPLVLTAAHVAGAVGERRTVRCLGTDGVELELEAVCLRVADGDVDLAVMQVDPDVQAALLPRLPWPPTQPMPAFPEYVLPGSLQRQHQPPQETIACAGPVGRHHRARTSAVLEVNTGHVLQMNGSELLHHVPVYYGSSGGALLHATSGRLIGIHTSWDLVWHHGIALSSVAIEDFLRDII
jgi:hypothetical protein